MQINILGTPELLGSEQPVHVPPRVWCVLVSLVMNPGNPVTLDTLIDRLWGEDPPVKARPTARSYITQMTQFLSVAAGYEIKTARNGRSYVLDVPAANVDVYRFRDFVRRADSAASRHAAVVLLRQAEEQWRGEALAGLPGAWADRVRSGLHEELRKARIARVEHELELGRHAALLTELAEFTQTYPADEELASQQMLALFRSGRQADALAAYQRVRRKLREYGLEPVAGLEDLYLRILRHDPRLRPQRRPLPGRNTLPVLPTDFVGRRAELGRMLTAGVQVVEGMAGSGKTALAVEAARLAAGQYPDAQLYLNLHGSDAELEPLGASAALRELLSMLGVEHTADTLTERREHWCREVAGRRIVLVLDDAAGQDQVRPLIPAQGQCLTIVTSRNRMNLETGERLILGTLADDDAIALFSKVAGTGVPADQLSTLAGLCGGLPMSIVLAATRLRAGGAPDDLMHELRDQDAGLADRVRSSFAASYRQLTAGAQRFFRYLGASPCREFTPSAAAALTGIAPDVSAEMLFSLAGRYLIEERSDGKYGFHDLVRSYARALCADTDPEWEVNRAILSLADHYVQEASGASQEWLANEYENVLSVAGYCGRHEQNRRCIELIQLVSEFLLTSGHWDHALRAHQTELRASQDSGDTRGVARASHALSQMCMFTGMLQDAVRHAETAAAAFADEGDERGRADATDLLGVVYRQLARSRKALAHHREAISIFRETGDDRGMARAMLHAATALNMLGRHTEEMAQLADALGVFRRLGDLRGQAIALNSTGLVQLGRGFHRDAADNFQEAHRIYRAIGGRQAMALLDRNMAEVFHYRGRFAEALVMFRRAEAEFRLIGDLRSQVYVLIGIGSVYLDRNQHEDAGAQFESALAAARKIGDLYACGLALCGVADSRRTAGALQEATTRYEQVLGIAGEIESPLLRARALEGRAETVLRTHGAEAARMYWREALDIYTELGAYQSGLVALQLEYFSRSHA
jgi:DNA-binding SARP family transcriptional activator